jgi:hypothetical protein
LTDFTSRFGRPFSAMLFLKENGRHGFEFQPRQPRGAKGAEKAEAAEGAAPDAVATPAGDAPAEAVPAKRKAKPAKKTVRRGPRKAAAAPEQPETRKAARRKT